MSRLLALVLAAGCSGVLACGGDEADPGPPVTEQTIVSTTSDFDVEAFAVRAGEEVTVTYDNQHDGVAHNLRFDIAGSPNPQTRTADGPDIQTITFSVAEPGEHTYVCDLHPATMRGTLVVE